MPCHQALGTEGSVTLPIGEGVLAPRQLWLDAVDKAVAKPVGRLLSWNSQSRVIGHSELGTPKSSSSPKENVT